MKLKKITAIIFMTAMLCSCAENIPEDAEAELCIITPATTTCITTEETTTVTTEVTEPPVTYTTVSFTALGDNLIHSSIYNQAAKRYTLNGGSGTGYDFEYAYEGVADLLDDADITVINQETLICNDKYAPSTYPRFNSPKALGDHMKQLGVDVFTIANNHTLDMGTDGLEACLDYYEENDMVCVGAYRNKEDRADIRIVERNGIKVSFLCYTEYLNGLSLPEGSPLEIGRTGDKELIKSEIEAAKKLSDICVVSLHWGLENSTVTEDYQREFAAELAEWGADVIIGNHPHVLREIDIIEKSDGSSCICAYSLGNFISAQSVGTNLIGGILNFDVIISSDENEPMRIDNMEFIPIVTHYDANYANVRLYTLEDYTPELASSHGVRAKSKFSYEYINEVLKNQGLI